MLMVARILPCEGINAKTERMYIVNYAINTIGKNIICLLADSGDDMVRLLLWTTPNACCVDGAKLIVIDIEYSLAAMVVNIQ